MTDSPNLELAEEIEALCAPHYACGVPPISSQNSTINSGWLQTGQHLPTCPIAIAAKIRALRAQPSGDWVWVPREATAEMVQAMEDRQIEGASYIAENSIQFALWKEVWKAAITAALSAAKERGR